MMAKNDNTTDKNHLPEVISKFDMKPGVSMEKIEQSIAKIQENNPPDPDANAGSAAKAAPRFMRGNIKRFHGIKASTAWFPNRLTESSDRNRFGYMTSSYVRNSTKLNFNRTNVALLNQLGDLMGNSGRESSIGDSSIPAGYTYFGQFVDHDITFDVSSSIDKPNNAPDIDNMRTPQLDLDSLYGEGPALNPFLYDFSNPSFPTAIKFLLGTNRDFGPGGPGGDLGAGGMVVNKDFDLPRMSGSFTAAIGDPRNDENLIVSQFHTCMLKFHNQVVDLLVMAGFPGDIFVEAKKMVTHHYQWALVHDYLRRICGDAAVDDALNNLNVGISSNVRMPVEFSVGAYRFGHSQIRDNYWLNFNFINEPLSNVFNFVRTPNLPVFSNWVVDFNAFFETGVSVPVFNQARKIDSVLSSGLETLPGASGIMAILAIKNLRRGLALGLPSGQGAAAQMKVHVLSETELTSGLPADEISLLNSQGGILMEKTPLWYYILREAAVLHNGDQLGPLGAKIVADTFITLLKSDANSFLHVAGGFTPTLPSLIPDTFNLEDLIIFAGASQP